MTSLCRYNDLEMRENTMAFGLSWFTIINNRTFGVNFFALQLSNFLALLLESAFHVQARIQAGAHPARAPLKSEKKMNFYSEINKKCQKSIKKAKNFRASLSSANI